MSKVISVPSVIALLVEMNSNRSQQQIAAKAGESLSAENEYTQMQPKQAAQPAEAEPRAPLIWEF